MSSTEKRDARLAAGLSQIEAAQRAGVSRSTYVAAEHGMRLSDASEAKITRALAAAIEENAKRLRKSRRVVSKLTTEQQPAAQ